MGFVHADVEEDWVHFVKLLKHGTTVVGGFTFLCLLAMCYDITWWRVWGISLIQDMQTGMTESGISTWEYLTYFGEDVPEFMAIIIYMSVDYGVGIRTVVLLSLVIYCNALLKTGFHDCRPYWYTTEVEIWGTCTRTWGSPATHASITASFYPFLVWEAYHLRKSFLSTEDLKAVKAAPVPAGPGNRMSVRSGMAAAVVAAALTLIILSVGLSRSVLGTHFPYQVLIGWLMGACILQVYLQYSPHIKKHDSEEPRGSDAKGTFLLNTVYLPVLLAIPPILTYHFVAAVWQPPELWNTNAHITCTQEDFEMDRSSAFIEAICGATMYGMLQATIYWHRHLFTFHTNTGSFGARFGRGLTGVFMVCVRSVFIKSAEAIHGIPEKACGMFGAVVVGNFFMFIVGPWLCVQCCLLDPPRTKMSEKEAQEEAAALLKA